MSKKSTSRKFIKLLLYFFALFIFQEIFFRFSFPLPEIKNLDRINYLNWHPDVNRTNYLRDQNWYWQSEPDTQAVFEHYMNRYGFRDDEWLIKKPNGKKRAIFIGDSFVEGLMAKQDETITAGFIKAAGEQEYEVFNAGMMGMGLNSYLQLLADIVPICNPEVVFFCIYANDFGQKQVVPPELYLEAEFYKWYIPRIIELFIQIKSNGPILFRWDNRIKPFLQAIPSVSNPWTKEEEKLKPHVDPMLAEAMKTGKFNPYRTNSLIKEERYLKKKPNLGKQSLSYNTFVTNSMLNLSLSTSPAETR
ncbi:MAG: SGNH/GDSL hydrolase family protein [Bacteroidales bacterium]